MPQPVSNTLTVVSGSLLANKISYVVDGQNRNYRGGFGGLSWMSEVEPTNNVIFIGNTSTIGRGPADKPLFYPSFNNTQANIVYAVNTLPGSPRNFTTSASAYNWAVTNNFFINNSNNPIPRIDADGLALYLDANQPTSYPQINNTWYDLSGQNNVTNLLNGPAWNSNGWFQFDGTDDWGQIPGLALSTTAYTKVAWFNPDGATNNIISGGGDGQHAFWMAGTATNLRAGHNGAWSTVDYSPGTMTGRWWFGAVTFNTSTGWVLYLNGSVVDTDASTTTFTGGTAVRIAAYDNASNLFNGKISTAQVYNRVLTTAEIKQNYFQSNIVQDGLVFMVDANNLVSYPKSGTTLYNLTSSISTVTGSLINGPTYGVENGGSIVFDGVDDYIDFDNLAGTLISNPSLNSNIISFSCWVLVSNPGSYYIISSGGQTGSTGVAFSYQNGSPFVNVQGNNFDCFININPSDFPLNTWINFTFVGNGSNLTVYKNGVYLTAQNYGSNALSDTYTILSLGRPNNFTGLTLGGKLAQVMFYSKALSATEVQQNYQATKDKFQGQQIVTNGLLLNLEAANKDSYPGTGTTWTNVATNAYNGTLYNGTSFRPNQNGGTIILDGVDDYVASSVNSALSNVATVVMLCYGTPSATDRMYCSFGYYDIYYYGSTNDRRLVFNTGNGDGYGCIGIPDTTISGLTMYTFVFRTDVSYTNNQIWINTTQQSLSQQFGTESPGTRNFTTGNFQIGGWIGGGYYPNIGVVDTLVYNRQLSSDEITQNYNAFRAKFGF
jgi:hypothetical protein